MCTEFCEIETAGLVALLVSQDSQLTRHVALARREVERHFCYTHRAAPKSRHSAMPPMPAVGAPRGSPVPAARPWARAGTAPGPRAQPTDLLRD